tara:strand:- start:348 stop:557 length:210 start_codon:yes stop_codon:yes gene_type:complete
MIKVEGYPNLYRDEKSGAIVNCDSMTYKEYVNSLQQKDLQKNELDKMKQDIDEIKSLLKLLTMDKNINI